MIKGLYSAASAMITGAYRQQAVAHDIANIDTAGFKQILTSLTDFDETSSYNQTSEVTANQLYYKGEIGLGVMASPETTDFSQGNLKITENSLDFAIEGEGFFRISTPDGERFTRDGRFILDSSNRLTTVDGNLVLSSTGQPIKLAEGAVTVSTTGEIYVNGTANGKFGLAVFTDPEKQLTRAGENSFSSSTAPASTGGGLIIQSTLEQSNVDTARLVTQMIEISRSYQAAQKMVQNQDELLGKSISSLGRIG